MKTKLIYLLSFLLLSTLAYGQHSIQSSVFDQKNGLALEMVTVRLFKQNDSTLVQGTQTDEKGSFMLSKVKDGKYDLVLSSVGYNKKKVDVTVADKDVILSSIHMNESINKLNSVDVQGTAAEMVVKKDTIEYNATAFKTEENAVVEDLLKKLPGVEVSSDGKITVNGEQIQNVRVDGKKFFSGDIEQATKNLPADMIDKIQVYDQKSDMAQLTGFEDDNTERIINLKTKPNRRHGIFGNARAGAGADINTDARYDGGTSINIMSDKAQTSIDGGGNNINNYRSSRGRGNWGGGANGGITTSQNIGVNNNTIVSDKVKFGGDMTLNHAHNNSITSSNRESYLSDITYNDISNNSSLNDKYDENMRLELEWKPDTLNTFIIQPTINHNTTSSLNSNQYSYLTQKDSTSWGNSASNGTNSSTSGGLNVIYSHKLTSKPGRTITARVYSNFSQNGNNTYYNSEKYTKDSTTLLNTYTTNKTNNFNYGMSVSYVEPLWNIKNKLQAVVSYNGSNTSAQKQQFDRDNQGNYSLFDSIYSNNFENKFYRENVQLNYRYNDDYFKIMLGMKAAPSQTVNSRAYGNGESRDTTYGVFNFAPTARIQYNFDRKKFARLDYRGRTQQPSVSQMQPVKNNTDLMNETVGNPLLNPAFSQNFRLMYSSFNATTFSSFHTFIMANMTKDALVSNKIYDKTLKQYSQTVNSSAMPVSFMWNIMYNTPIIAKTLHFNTNTRTGYNTNYSYVSRNVNMTDINVGHLMLGDLSKTRRYSAMEALSLSYTGEMVEVGLRGSIAYSNSLNNLKNIVTETWDWSGRGNVLIHFPYDITLGSDISYSNRSGYTNMNLSEIMWNASLDYTTFSNKGTFSLKANDILHQRLNIRQTVGDNYIQNSSFNTLPSYVILSFTYKLNRFGNRNNRDDRFGPGRGPRRGPGRGDFHHGGFRPGGGPGPGGDF